MSECQQLKDLTMKEMEPADFQIYKSFQECSKPFLNEGLVDLACFKKNTLLNHNYKHPVNLQPALSSVFLLEWVIHLHLKFFTSDLKHCFQQEVLIPISHSPESAGERLITNRGEGKDAEAFVSEPDIL